MRNPYHDQATNSGAYLRNPDELKHMGHYLLSQPTKRLSKKIVGHLQKIRGTEEEFHLEVRSLFVLGWIGNEEAKQTLISYLESPNPNARAGAGFTLAQIDEIGFLYLLLPLLNDSSELVRNCVGFAIGWCGGQYHFDVLKTYHMKGLPFFRQQSLMILESLAPKRAAAR